MANRRRVVLGTLGSALASSLAGCLDGLGENGEDNGTSATATGNGNGNPDTLVAVSGAFPQYQYDAGNTGAASDSDGPTGAIRSLFEFGDGRIGSPTVADGTVYLTEEQADADNEARTTVAAIDALDGTTAWETVYPNTTAPGPTAVTEDYVLARLGGSVVALDPATGDQQWAVAGALESGIAVTEDTVYTLGTGAESATLYALSVADGTRRWEHEVDAGTFLPTPAVGDGTVYVGGTALQALGTESGTEQWRIEEPVSAPPTVLDGTVVAVAEDTLVVSDVADGAELWRGDLDGFGRESVTASNSPAVADDTVYVSAAGGIEAFDLESGDREYGVELGIDGPPVVAGDYVYLSGTGTLVCLEAFDGTTEWSYGTQQRDDVDGVAPAVLDDVAYFPAEKLYAIAE